MKRSNIFRIPDFCSSGSHVGQGAEQGIQFIVDALNETITDDDGPMILLEGMAGKGSEIGRNFDEIAQIIQGVSHDENLGICIDTCHLHSAGYDIVNNLSGVSRSSTARSAFRR